MGVGTADCLVEGVARGIDMFDGVYPTRVALKGMAMTWKGRLNIRNAQFAHDWGPLENHSCSYFERRRKKLAHEMF